MTERERILERIRQWKMVDEEMDRERAERLQGMGEGESARIFDMLVPPNPAAVWRRPERLQASGMVEQQWIFMRAHAAGG
jgi:hypothetical protein